MDLLYVSIIEEGFSANSLNLFIFSMPIGIFKGEVSLDSGVFKGEDSLISGILKGEHSSAASVMMITSSR